MGNSQTNEKQPKTGKSPAKGKHFIRNLNRKSVGRESKKGRKKSESKRDGLDKTPDSEYNDHEVSENDTLDCVFKTVSREDVEPEHGRNGRHGHSEVTGRCARSVTPPASADSVSSGPRTPSAVELNQCYYSSSIDSPENTMLQNNANANSSLSLSPIHLQKDVLDALDNYNLDKQEVFDDTCVKGDDEKVMGALLSGLRRGEQLERSTHECNHEFRENRLKASPGTTAFTLTRPRKVDLTPITCDPSVFDNEIAEKEKRRLSSLSDVPMESNVLRKVASLTLEQNSEARVTRPKFVPEKLDFQLYEKFEGQMLLNWFVSSVSENTHLKSLLSAQDLKNLGTQYCTHLLAAGVLRQISDKNAPNEKIFKPSLMYYWAHMEAPASQPVTPGRLQMSAWPPEKDSSLESVTSPSILENYTNVIQNNNEEISDISQAKIIISHLKTRLQQLEFQLEKLKITSDIELLNKNLQSFGLSSTNLQKNCVDLISKEVQTDDDASTAALLNTVIHKPDSVSVETNVNMNNIVLSGDHHSYGQDKQNELDARSDKIENYCKLNKSTDNKTPGKDAVHQTSNQELNVKSRKEDFGHQHEDVVGSRNMNCEVSTSDESFQSTTSGEISSYQLNSSLDFNRRDLSLKNIPTAATQVLFVVKKHCATPSSSFTSSNNTSEYGSPRLSEVECKGSSPKTSPGGTPKISAPELQLDCSPSKHTSVRPPPPMPGAPPSPPPMPGRSLSPVGSPQSVPPLGYAPPPPAMSCMVPPPPPMPGMGPPPPPPMPGMGPPPPPPMPGMGPPPPPPMPGMGPPPPPMPGMGPPPPPMPGMGPPPPPMPGMCPPPPPMPGMGPPPPPMMGMSGPPPSGPGPPPPPGPPSGPVPFPAPPVGGWNVQRAALRKTAVKPSAPMRPLYWTRILAPPTILTHQTSTETIKPLWLEIDEAPLDNIDEFTDLFSRQVVEAPVKKKKTVTTKIQPVKILDSKRSQNVGILAQSLHVEFSEIENAVYNFDTSVVSLEALQQIYELRATAEELSMIKQHLSMNSDVPLDRPEAFLHDLSGIPNFAERISCFMFQAEFEDAISTTMHKLDNLKHTCEFLASNEPLKKLFAIILTLGNYMNGGNGQRGQADGFGLEILAKLKDVKSKQSNITLLHFIVRTYMRQCGGALSEECAMPAPEPGDVVRAAAIDFADVATQLTTLRTQLTACKKKSKKVMEDDAKALTIPDVTADSSKRLEVFKEKMTTFLEAAEEKLKAETENLEECRTKFIATVRFYQYTPKCGKVEDCEPKEFFSLWTSFCSDVKDIYKKEEQLAIKEKLKETKKLAEERKSLTQTKPKREGGLKARLQKLSSTRKS